MSSGASSGIANSLTSSAARTTGHWISLVVTGVMMIVVDAFMVYTLKQRKREPTACRKYGPLILCFVATPLIMAEPTRHILGDTGVWQWCGDNTDFPRFNQTWNDGCFASSTEYQCNVPCCVPEAELDTLYPGILDPNRSPELQSELDTLAELYPTSEQADVKDGKFPELDLSQWGDLFKNSTTGAYECTCQCTAHENMFHLSPVGWIFTVTLTYLGFIGLAVGSLWNANIIDKCKKMKKEFRALRGERTRRMEEGSYRPMAAAPAARDFSAPTGGCADGN